MEPAEECDVSTRKASTHGDAKSSDDVLDYYDKKRRLRGDQDPYSALDRNRNRTEVLIEVSEKPRQFTLPSTGSDDHTEEPPECTEVTHSQWMKGVPHGSEQSVSAHQWASTGTEAPAFTPTALLTRFVV